MTGILIKAALTSTTQKVRVGLQNPPVNVTLNSTAPGRGIRFSTSDSGADNTFFSPSSGMYDAESVGAISWNALAPIKWVEFTGQVGDIYEVL